MRRSTRRVRRELEAAKVRPRLALARELLDTAWRFREGGLLGRVVTALTVAESVLDRLDPPREPAERLQERGLRAAPVVLERVWGRLLGEQTGTAVRLGPQAEGGGDCLYWPDEGVGMVRWPEHSPDLFVSEQPPGIEGLGRLLRGVVWRRGPALQLRHSVAVSGRWRGSVEQVHFEPISPAGDIVGSDVVARIVARVQARGGATTLLLRGPTGVGKSCIARRVVGELCGGNARLLQIPGAFLDKVGGSSLLEIVELLQPSVLLLDDVEFDLHGRLLLVLLEALRDPAITVVLTEMLSPGEPTDGCAPGRLYRAGMRPGRIDEIVTIPPPAEPQRRAILRHYLGADPPPELVRRAAGLPGAYLKELAARLRVRGLAALEDELPPLLAQAPVAPSMISDTEPPPTEARPAGPVGALPAPTPPPSLQS